MKGMIVLTDKNIIINSLELMPELKNFHREQIDKIIDSTHVSQYNFSNIENLLEQLDDKKKQLLLKILNSVSEV